MSDTVIQVNDLSKQYRLGQIGTGSLAHDVNRLWYRLRGKEDPYLKIGEVNERTTSSSGEYVWALHDVNFKVKLGEVLGIIGRNGAGKSTLLKILSRTTIPTTGQVKIKGRVASLLEVGTGFHPELTGRENIFLNGAILGMTKREIRNKFDEIVDFAGVERYIDTPVKRYSSGMYVRLAFAVAAHLEPEILIVDEVLAVGDMEFQNKCLGKMKDVSEKGRTVLFVSHNMGAIMQLCQRGILLKDGKLVVDNQIKNVVDYYVNKNNTTGHKIEKNIVEKETNQFIKIYMTDDTADIRSEYRFDEEISIRAELYLPKFSDSLELAMRLIDKHKRAVFTIHEKLVNHFNGEPVIKLNIKVPTKFLTPGHYSWVMCINHPGLLLYDLQDDIAAFKILETGSDFSRYQGADYGVVFVDYNVQKIDN